MHRGGRGIWEFLVLSAQLSKNLKLFFKVKSIWKKKKYSSILVTKTIIKPTRMQINVKLQLIIAPNARNVR